MALAVPAAIFGVLAARDGGDEGSSPCELQDQPSQGQAHVSDAGAGFQYSTFPPTSGPAASDPVPWNAYDAPLAQSRIVHNLSHGGIAVQYGRGVSSDAVRRVLSWYRADPDGLVVAPLPELGGRLALTAWTHLMLCERFDQDAFDAFRSAHRFEGPERLPREALQPEEREPERALVEDLSLWPRPFADSLSISLTLSKEAAVTVMVLDEQGRAIRTLREDVSLAAGPSSPWSGTGRTTRAVASQPVSTSCAWRRLLPMSAAASRRPPRPSEGR